IMADAEHAPSMAPPIRTDEQIMPHIRWMPIGKSNCYLNEEKSQPSLIFKIAVDILKQTNFFRAFTASSTIPAIYIQQFWDTICFDSKAGDIKCPPGRQMVLISLKTHSEHSSNHLGYPREVINLSNVTTNDMFQPWRALTTIINLCLTGKTSGFERPRAPVLQILWGVVNRAHIDYAERMWEEFTQSIHNFTKDKRNLAQQAQGKKKVTIILIPSIRFTKLIIFHLQRLHNFHPRPESPLHLPTEEPVLVAKHQRYLVGKEVSDPDSPAPNVPAAKPRLEDTEEAIQAKKETDTGKLQPLPERHTPGTINPVGHEESSSLYDELGLYGSDTESDEEMPSVVRSGAQDEGQARPDPGKLDDGHAGPDPGKLDEGQTGPNPDDVAESQPLPTPSVLAGPNLEHSDVEITDPSSQPQPEHMDEGFTAATYPDVQKNLKLTVDEQVIPEEPVNACPQSASNQKSSEN
ncbi:hypothetical protein Tco_1339544, partial [Tanacetum coccineum]